MPANESKVSRRAFLKSTGAVGAMALLAACAPVGSPGGGAAPAEEAKSLSVWAFRSFAPPADDILLGQIDTWGKENNVDLEVVAEIEVPTMNERLMAGIESKVLPDMSAIAGGRVALHYPAGIFADVSDFYAQLSDELGGFFRAAEQTATIDGKQWVIPASCDTSLMYYRKDILDEKGVAIPKTWQEYTDNLKAAQTPPDMYGSGIALNKASGDGNGTLTMMMYSFGASLVAEDGVTITADSQEMRDWLTFFVEGMYNQGIFPPGIFEWDNASNNAAYQDETVISINNPASVLIWLLENKPEIAAATAIEALPAGPKGAFSSAGTRFAWSIFNTTPAEKQELSKGLIHYLMSPEQYEPWITAAFAAPSTLKYAEMELWNDPQRAGFLEATKNGVMLGYPGPITPAAAELDSLMPATSMALRVIIDGWSVDEAVLEAAQVATDIYSKHA